jgi:alkanesulfonate monooxygenase SsuD/methylene tetrahydromethanopterin reductase-like flavin-dependent oxidoreductase (luciferase family)
VVLPIRRWSRQQEMWRAVERLGFDHAWTYDHLTWDPFVAMPWGATIPTLVAAAGVTSRIRLGTWVASPNYRHPVPFARELAGLDDISGGRAVLGIGAGGTGGDATVLGGTALSAGERAERLEEFVELVDAVLTRASTSHEGKHYRVHEARTTLECLQRPRVPFVIAANGPRTMRLALRHGAGWATTGPRPSEVAGDQAWWRGVADLVDRFEQAREQAGVPSLDRLLSVDAAPTFSLVSIEKFRDVVGRAGALGFTDVVVHWPVPGAPRYDASEDMVEQVAAELDSVHGPDPFTASPGGPRS